MKRKILNCLLLFALICIISSCSVKTSIFNMIQQKLLKESNIAAIDEDYKIFEEFRKNNQINDEGYYIDSQLVYKGKIKIHFFENNHLSTDYYYDEARTELVDQKNCYLNPGDSLYADYPKIINQKNNKYEFSSFLVYAYIDNMVKDEFASSNTDGKIFTIPKNYSGENLYVMPVGEYKNRDITLHAFVYDKGSKTDLTGEWIINGKEYFDSFASIDSSTPYRVSYDYSAYIDEFYFFKSTPNCYKNIDSICVVEFFEEEIDSTIDTFEVELKRYKNLEFINNTINLFGNNHLQEVKINGSSNVVDIQKKDEKYNRIKEGDIIIVKLDKGYKTNVDNLEISNVVQGLSSVEYTIKVPEGDELELSIKCEKNDATLGAYEQQHINNATIDLFYEDGTKIKNGEEVKDDEKIVLLIKPDNGYYLTGDSISDNIYKKSMKYKDYCEKIDEIIDDHDVLKYLSINLITDDKYGKVVYTYGGNEVSGLLEVKENDIIKVTYVLENEKYELTKHELFNQKKYKFEIMITEELNGKKINVKDYIEIKRK